MRITKFLLLGSLSMTACDDYNGDSPTLPYLDASSAVDAGGATDAARDAIANPSADATSDAPLGKAEDDAGDAAAQDAASDAPSE
jgi:hypothetical protein